MKGKRGINIFRIYFFVIFFLCSPIMLIQGFSKPAVNFDDRLSICFGDVTVNEALHKLSRKTGIEIFVNYDMEDKLIKQIYDNWQFSEILMDLFRNKNNACVFESLEKGINRVEVWVIDDNGLPTAKSKNIERSRFSLSKQQGSNVSDFGINKNDHTKKRGTAPAAFGREQTGYAANAGPAPPPSIPGLEAPPMPPGSPGKPVAR